jgi:pyrroloquinoline-quinone synthase
MNMTVSSAGPRERSRSATVPPLFRQAADEFTGRLLRHPFLVRCSEGRATMDELRSYLVQQGKYSRYFTRYLCALMSYLEDGGDVLHLAENLAEELGFGEDDDIPHTRLYTQMLASFGIDLDKQPIHPETQNLIDTMFMLCRQPGGISGLGALCLGAEAIVPPVYACIIDGFRGCGVDIGKLAFFTIHVDCDDGHADTMFELMARSTANSIARRISAIQAGEIAINARLRVFDTISKGAH